MSTLTDAMEVATQAMAHDPRSATTSESVAFAVQTIDQFLASPLIEALFRLDAEARVQALFTLADQIRSLIERLRDMLSVAAQTEQRGGPVSWAPPLADAIGRLEAAFYEVPDLSRKSPPPIVARTTGPVEESRVTEEKRIQSTDDDVAETLDVVIEDTHDLIKARSAEFFAKSRGEVPLRWESVRNDLDDA